MKRIFAVVAILSVSLLAAQRADSGTGYLKTKIDPGRAGVFIDGQYKGPAANFRIARKFTLPEGEHEIKLSDPRFEEVSRKVTIRAGKTTTLSEQLRPLPIAQPPFGRLRVIDFDKYAAVYLNGRFYGHADEFSNFAQGLLVSPGEYSVSIVPAGGSAAHEEKVRIEADKITIVKAK